MNVGLPSRNILYLIVRVNDSRTNNDHEERKQRSRDKGSTRSMSRIESKQKNCRLRWGNRLQITSLEKDGSKKISKLTTTGRLLEAGLILTPSRPPEGR